MVASTEALTNLPELSVTELSNQLKRTVEDNYAYVRVRGEVSGYKGPHSNGHAYFTLKDENACLEAVVWRLAFQRLRFKPEEGLEVVATGRITTYPRSSKYQILIEALEPAGIGALMALLEQRKQKLKAEGLFDAARKKPLPHLPEVIGIITSPTGAVIRDILHRLADRFPRRVVIWPVRVQGAGCAQEIAAAIAGFNALGPGLKLPRPDVLIVARGGGSLEDLWGFNEEIVARAAAASVIPLISAVGHETDFTLIDFVADQRAPTPTAAAEMVVPVRVALAAEIEGFVARLRAASGRQCQRLREGLRSLLRVLPAGQALFSLPRQRFHSAGERLPQALRANAHTHRLEFANVASRHVPFALARQVERGLERCDALWLRAAAALVSTLRTRGGRLAALDDLLRALSYREVLGRGFALVWGEAGRPIRSVGAIAAGERLEIEFADGKAPAVSTSGTIRRRRGSGGPGSGQGSLFD